MVERHLRLARRLGERVDAEPELERLADVNLNIVCFRARPEGAAEEDLDELNRELGAALLADGRVFAGTTNYKRQGRPAAGDRQLADDRGRRRPARRRALGLLERSYPGRRARDGVRRREPFDVVILGGGTAGCVLAARLSEEEGRRVCLVEAGPDYGAFDAGAWPEEMLDPTTPPSTHDWESGAELSLARARVIGGCSSHNACFVVHAHPSDYDAWGVPGWDQAGLDPHLRAAERAIHARPPAPGEVGPWSRAVVEAAGASGIEVLDDFNRPVPGAGVLPLNVERGARWNTAFAYLDGARDRENLTVLDRAVVDRVLIEDGQAVGAAIQRDGTGAELTASTVIVAAGAYGSPLILLRSGIGPAEHLA